MLSVYRKTWAFGTGLVVPPESCVTVPAIAPTAAELIARRIGLKSNALLLLEKLYRKLRPTSKSSTMSAPSELSVQLFQQQQRDRKSTRLNSSHLVISYAVFCLKKK